MNNLSTHSPLGAIANISDRKADADRLSRYQETLSPDTLRRQRFDLALFQRYLFEQCNTLLEGLFIDLSQWEDISYGLVEDFKRWQKEEGFALSSLAFRLATVHVYVRLAYEAGFVSFEQYLRIKEIKGYPSRQQQNIDEARLPEKRRRPGSKRAEPVVLSALQIRSVRLALLDRMNFCTGAEYRIFVRDLALFCLLAYQGFRVGEVVRLERSEIFLERGLIIVHRHKVHKEQTHEMHPATLVALKTYVEVYQTRVYLFEGRDRDPYMRNGKRHAGTRAIDGMDEDSIALRVTKWGKMIGVEGLAPHGLRHSWAHDLAENDTSIEAMKEAGGWSSYKMVEHYRGKVAIANKGVKQS